MTDTLAKVRRRGRRLWNAPQRLWNYHRIKRALQGKRGLEIGGPSRFFSPATPNRFIPPVYEIVAALDNCNFTTNTTWSEGEAGRTFEYLPGREPGMQYIHEATDLSSIQDSSYEFLLVSHILEHVANPLRALKEFHRVLKPNGYMLIMVPNRLETFDHWRPATTFAHLEADLAANTDESDMTHLEEVLTLHDLEMDPLAGSREQFRERCLRNREMRCMHHHVFDLGLLDRSLRSVGFHSLYSSTNLWDIHILIFAQRS